MREPRDNAPMCDVHLIETSRALCSAPADLRCGYCDAPIHGEALYVEGHLDDGSPGLYRFASHDGCFNYGTPLSLDDCPLTALAEGQ